MMSTDKSIFISQWL